MSLIDLNSSGGCARRRTTSNVGPCHGCGSGGDATLTDSPEQTENEGKAASAFSEELLACLEAEQVCVLPGR